MPLVNKLYGKRKSCSVYLSDCYFPCVPYLSRHWHSKAICLSDWHVWFPMKSIFKTFLENYINPYDWIISSQNRTFFYLLDFVRSTYLLKQLWHHCPLNPWCGWLASCCSSGGLNRNLWQPVKYWFVILSPPMNPSQGSPLHGILLPYVQWYFVLHRKRTRGVGRGRCKVLFFPLPLSYVTFKPSEFCWAAVCVYL